MLLIIDRNQYVLTRKTKESYKFLVKNYNFSDSDKAKCHRNHIQGVIWRFSLSIHRARLDRCQRYHTFYSYYFFMLFTELELKEPILRGLKQLGYEQTTPIQEQTIVAFANGKDIV